MAPLDWKSWPEQSPPPDFAKRTLTRMLLQKRRQQRSRRRWTAALALAAVLAVSGAWAMIERQKAKEPPVSVPPETSAQLAPMPGPTAIEGRPIESAEPVNSAPPLMRPLGSSKKAPVLVPPVAPPSASSPKSIRVPRCDCSPKVNMCTCIE